MQGRLILEDGTVYVGIAFGATGTALGEVVFNTGMTGYQEVLTDPSYCGQILTMTYPIIGNTGIVANESQSHRPLARGMIVNELWSLPQHSQMVGNLDEYLREHGLIGLQEVDTRALTRRLRRHGTMSGAITTEAVAPATLLSQLGQQLQDEDLVGQAGTSQIWHWPGQGPKLVIVDLGIKFNLLRFFQQCDCHVVVVPPITSAQDILAMRPDGVLFSSGPGNPQLAAAAVQCAGELLGQLQLFGVCLGHQILALAQGANTFKLFQGHRGGNHPVRDLTANTIRMTAQNHGYAVERESLTKTGLEITHVHLHDQTIEGLINAPLKTQSVQYHPEVGPGPRDTGYVLADFAKTLGATISCDPTRDAVNY